MGWGVLGLIYYLWEGIRIVVPFFLLIIGAVWLIIGIDTRVKYNGDSELMKKSRSLIIVGFIIFLPGAMICGERGVNAITQAVDNHNSVYYQLYNGSVGDLERLLKKGACVEGAGLPVERPARDGGCTLLGTVSEFSSVIPDGTEKVALLIEYGADVNRVMCWRCEYGHPRGEHKRLCSATPVLFAADGCNYEVLKLLIDNGGDVNATDYNGLTPLDIVEENIKDTERFHHDNIKIIEQMRELLIANGAKNGNKGAEE